MLSSTQHYRSIQRLRELQDDVAAMRPEADPEVRRDLAVNEIVQSTAALLALPRTKGAREIADLKLVVSQLSRYVLLAEFSA